MVSHGVDDFLADLAARLRGPARWRRRVLDEIADGLASSVAEDAVAADRRGLERTWGSPVTLAAEFNAVGAGIRARQLARRLLLGLPLLAVGWAAVVRLSPDPWPHEPEFIKVCIRLLLLAGVLAVSGSAVVLLRGRGVGGLLRRLPSRPAVFSAAFGFVAVEAVSYSMLFYRASAAAGAISWPLAVAPGVLSLLLLALTSHDVYRLVGAERPRRLSPQCSGRP